MTLVLPTPLAEANGASVFHLPWQELRPLVSRCDLLCVDAPYSEKTHAGHDEALAGTGIENGWKRSDGGFDPATIRRTISYRPWTPEDVRAFVEAWHPVCAGWFVTITDHILAPVWTGALEAAGRYVFAPLPYVARGSRVRLTGDGPSAWTCWIIVARPKTREFARWGTLPGEYTLPAGLGEKMPVVGGKPRWLMEQIVRDYSREDGLVCDPCCGAGTALVSAIRLGRRAIGGDICREHADLAAQWIQAPNSPAPGLPARAPEGQLALWGG